MSSLKERDHYYSRDGPKQRSIHLESLCLCVVVCRYRVSIVFPLKAACHLAAEASSFSFNDTILCNIFSRPHEGASANLHNVIFSLPLKASYQKLYCYHRQLEHSRASPTGQDGGRGAGFLHWVHQKLERWMDRTWACQKLARCMDKTPAHGSWNDEWIVTRVHLKIEI